MVGTPAVCFGGVSPIARKALNMLSRENSDAS
jgi:hypothetical protein